MTHRFPLPMLFMCARYFYQLVNLRNYVDLYVFHTDYMSCVKPFCDIGVKRGVYVCFVPMLLLYVFFNAVTSVLDFD